MTAMALQLFDLRCFFSAEYYGVKKSCDHKVAFDLSLKDIRYVIHKAKAADRQPALDFVNHIGEIVISKILNAIQNTSKSQVVA